ncbi:MAG: UPF0158 family protein [bacterium]
MVLDVKAILQAIQERSRDTVHLLDKKTGNVQSIKASELDSPKVRELLALRQKEPARFAEIPRLPAEEIYKDMKAFLAVLKDPRLREKIDRLIEGGGGNYRDFLDVLRGKEREEEQWFHFREERMHTRLRGWLKTVGLEGALDIKT